MATPLHVSHDYPFSPERFIAVYFDRGFTAWLDQHLDVSMSVDVLEDKPTTILRTVRTVPNMDLPAFARAIFGGKKGFSYLETATHTKGTRSIAWSILPSVIPDKFSMTGVTRIEPLGDGGCRRIVDASLEIKVFAIGPRLEETVVKSVSDSYTKGHSLMVDYEKATRR